MAAEGEKLPEFVDLRLTRDEFRLVALAWAVNKLYVTRHISGPPGAMQLKLLETTFTMAFMLTGGPVVANKIDQKIATVLSEQLKNDGVDLDNMDLSNLSDAVKKVLNKLGENRPSEEHNTLQGIQFDEIIPPSIRKRLM